MNLDKEKFVCIFILIAVMVLAYGSICIDLFCYNKEIKPYKVINSEKAEYYIGVEQGNDVFYYDFITIDISKRDSFIHVWDKQLNNTIDIHKKIK